MAEADSFDLVIEGRGGHGAAPHLCVDPVVVAAEVVTALQRVISREIDPVEAAVLTIGAINGGSTYNVISPRVSLKGAIRWFTDRTRQLIVHRVEQIAKHVCEASNATCTVSWLPPCPATVNDNTEAAFVKETLTNTFGAERVVESPLVMLSEDFSCFLRVVPGCFYFLGAGNATHCHPNHHPARDSGSSIDADARNTEFFMAGLRDGLNGLRLTASVADAYDIGFGAGLYFAK